MSNLGLFKSEVNKTRATIKAVAERVLDLKQSPLLKLLSNEDSPVDPKVAGESIANIMLAYRHLEDARMRLGKAIQAVEGESIYDKNRPRIIAICGSTRFIEKIAAVAWNYEKQGYITFAPMLLPASVAVAPDHCAEAEGVKRVVDSTFLSKIDLADEVFVVNIGGYIGQSTRDEISHAKKLGKPVSYLVANLEAPSASFAQH